ncbi:Uncharacterized OsmC-related protein [Paramicrobacterium humi]|uniref:Uncharacterized OsmC-related protein n=1 Tax=Paramicrobacterium humi TaxID=640635 RepID=A0A1H4J4W4_9MICO|nr:OsmC family protein [Microbacterium humi]SEB41006.1 Uncharacterized OsmC-related protein [Microbacterium humi]
MSTMTVALHSISGTRAAVGAAGSHTLVVDRPPDVAGGLGLGFNGGQLLALAIGGCLCNDVQYAAHDMGVVIDDLHVEVELTLEGQPARVTGVNVTVEAQATDGSPVDEVIRRAKAASTVGNSVASGFPVQVSAVPAGR